MQRIIYAVVIILSWLINPWLGISCATALMTFKSHLNKTTFPLTACLITLTVILYQLNLPMPYDLIHTKSIYHMINVYPVIRTAWIIRDPLSYGTLSILSYFFPTEPILYYLLNTIINFLCIWIIFKKEEASIENNFLRAGIFLGLFLAALNFGESHHYMRQTTALLMFMTALYYDRGMRFTIILVSLLWHGSVILLLPVLLFRHLRLSKKNLFIYLSILISCFLFSQINIYEFLKVPELTQKTIFDFSFIDRFMTYFQQPRHESFFRASYETGNPTTMIYVAFSLFTMAYAYFRKSLGNIFLVPVMLTTLLLVAFQHHVLIFSRLIYMQETFLFLYWAIEIKNLKVRDYKIIPVLTFVLCLMKIHFFVWSMDTSADDGYLFFKSPVTLLSHFNEWPINQPE